MLQVQVGMAYLILITRNNFLHADNRIGLQFTLVEFEYITASTFQDGKSNLSIACLYNMYFCVSKKITFC